MTAIQCKANEVAPLEILRRRSGRAELAMAFLSVVAVVIAVAVVAFGAGHAGAAQGDRPLRVFVTIPPQAFFAEQIGGARVRVSILVAPGQSPHSYEPTPRQMASMARADLYLTMMTPFERRLTEKFPSTFRRLPVVDISRGIERRRMRPAAHTHGAG